VLRQTVIALRGGRELAEHPSPGEATIHVISGRVLLESEGVSWSGWDGDLLIIPPANHTLKALEDSVVLLTVAKLI
jgi:quercetin dioxygenase-like cupin family protein